MANAGFSAVETVKMTLVLHWRSPAECIQYLLDVSPDLSARLASHSAGQRASFRAQLEERLRPFTTIDGRVQIPNETICAVGRY